MFTSCSPQKRLSNLLKNHPELLDSLKTKIPAVSIHDTIKADTFIKTIIISDLDTVETIVVNDTCLSKEKKEAIKKRLTNIKEKLIYVNRIKDTTLYKDGYTIKLGMDNKNNFIFDIKKPQTNIDVKQIKVYKEMEWYRDIWFFAFVLSLTLFIILLIKK